MPTHTVHAGFSLVVPVKPDAVAAARAVLTRMRASADTTFAGAPSTHFLTGAVLDKHTRGKRDLPPTLLLLSSHWGPVGIHLDELIAVAGKDLRALFSSCEGFPDAACTDADLKHFMRRHKRADTFYSGMNHVTHREVRDEHALREAIQTYLDEQLAVDGFAGLEPWEVRIKIQQFVNTRDDLAWARERRVTTVRDALIQHRHLILVVALASALFYLTVAWFLSRNTALAIAAGAGWGAFGVFLVVVAIMALSVRSYEKHKDRYVAGRPPDAVVKAIALTQLNPAINEMTIGGPIKDGWWRPTFLRLALWVAARYVTTAKITIPTVATARWLAIDGGRRLIFVSNFTNMSEPYVRDFIDIKNGAMRINLLFGQGHGYPTTEWVIRRGAVEDSNGFIHVVNSKQHLTELWYCPYKNLTIDNININRQIRQGLFAPYSAQQAKEWLKLL